MKKILLGLCALSVLYATSCKKKDDDGGSVDKKSTLTTGKWQLTGANMSYSFAGQNQNVDIYSTFYQACERDNYYFFAANGTATMDEGATKCDSGDPQTSDAGAWQLLNNDTQLKCNIDGAEQTFDITSFNSSGMTLTIETNYMGATAKQNMILTHIN